MGVVSAMNQFIKQLESTNKRSGGEIVGRVIIDILAKRILFIPENENHVKFLAKFLGKKKLIEVLDISRYVGSALRVENGVVAEILVGISGLETWYKEERGQSLHTKQQVIEGKNILFDILLRENVPLIERLKIEVAFV
ncbi:hypothetical protein HY483_04050 [Candidatus Woesearchaeota archaeon]|nr:hypothetical protein [Candidatus Woesearchaeota archaeon]